MQKLTTQQGVISRWQDDKGFGFIDSTDGQSIFFHISEYRPPRKPIIGEKVVFQLGEDKQGRKQAKKVQSADFAERKQAERLKKQEKKMQRQAQNQAFENKQTTKLVGAVVFYGLLACLAVFKFLPWVIVIWYLLIGLVTFIMYAHDKKAAQNNKWRTKESTLHSFSLLGGWVGAMLAHAYLRHKSQKAEFRAVYYVTVVINMALLCGYLYFLVIGF